SSNSDARAQVYLAAASYGLHYCHVDIVMNTITIHTNIGTGSKRQPLTVVRSARKWTINFTRLSAVDRLIRSIHTGFTPPSVAEQALDDIEAMKSAHHLHRTAGLGDHGWGFFCHARRQCLCRRDVFLRCV